MKIKKNELARQQVTFKIAANDELPNGEFEAILSTSELDRHGEIVDVKGVEIPNRVIKMYYNHETYGDKLPIGKWLKIWKDGNKLMGHGQVDLEDSFATKVYKKIKGGFLDSISIGFYPKEYDGETATWTESELVEASVVAEPANVGAVVTQKELGFSEEEFNKSLKVRLKNTDEPDESDDAATKAAIDELKSKVGSLEKALEASSENPEMKTLIRLRVAGKEVDKSAEQFNRIIKVKLKKENSNNE